MRATFSLDEDTATALRRVAAALGTSKSDVVRRAVLEFEARRDRLTEAERRRKLLAIERLRALPPGRSAAAVKRELDEIRKARRTGWRSGQ
ncbi:MAG TPA: ribbon-helix-helix protein, CopG family [Candidatus Limnocylindrales bacterium]|jgi:hypothetical protein